MGWKNSRRLVAVGTCCPNCGRRIQRESLVDKSELKQTGEGAFEWNETHKCMSCETKFIVKNSNQ